MSLTPSFNASCGENVELSESNTKAKWVPKHSGGWAYCENPLEPGHTLNVTVQGSGHYDVGFISKDPKNITHTEQTTPSFKQLNEVKIHKKECMIPVELNNEGTELTSTYNGVIYRRSVDKKSKLWITVYIKFGDMKAAMSENGVSLKFSQNSGTNINLGDDNTLATTIKKNPASLCFLNKPISVKEQCVIRCKPISDGERSPSRYHVDLQVFDKNPEELLSNFKHLFHTSSRHTSGSPCKSVELLEKEACDGDITFTLVDDITVEYTHGVNKRGSQKLTVNAKSGIWLLLDIYRVEVAIVKVGSVGSRSLSQGQAEAGFDVVDAKPMYPGDEFNESSYEEIRGVEARIERLENNQNVQRLVSNVGVSSGTSRNVENSNTANARLEPSIYERLSTLEHAFATLQLQTTGSNATSQPVVYASNDTQGAHSNTLTASVNARLERLETSVHNIENRGTTNPGEGDESSGNPDDVVDIQTCFLDLLADLEPSDILDHLFQGRHIKQNEMNEIRNMAQKSPRDANRELLNKMKQKRITRKILAPILQNNGQDFLIPKLFPPKSSKK